MCNTIVNPNPVTDVFGVLLLDQNATLLLAHCQVATLSSFIGSLQSRPPLCSELRR
jgi:hypothetical protein